MAEQVVLRTDRGVEVGQVDSGALQFNCHPTILTIRNIVRIGAGSLACMPKPDQDSEVPRDASGGTAPPAQHRAGPMSGFGVVSAILAVVAVAAVALIAVLWNQHRGAEADRRYQARVMQAAAEWTGVLINMNGGNVETSMAQLRDGTVGELNTGFDASIAPYREVVKTLNAKTTGQVESVSVEVVHNQLASQPGQRPPAPTTLPAEMASRTDTVLVVATSVSENAGGKPTTVRWNLRLGVSEVDGTPRISRLESLR
jgi:hypothetical protein